MSIEYVTIRLARGTDPTDDSVGQLWGAQVMEIDLPGVVHEEREAAVRQTMAMALEHFARELRRPSSDSDLRQIVFTIEQEHR